MRLEPFVRAVGWTSLALAGVAVARPRALAAAGGVVPVADASLPLLVRLAAARQGVLGLALLTRTPVPVARASGLFLPLTALDAAAVLLAVRQGVLRPRAAALSTCVLAVNAAVSLRSR